MPNYSGQLNHNEVLPSLLNFIISIRTFTDNIAKVKTLVSRARVDGGMYGDTKIYTSTQALHSREWLNDLEAGNLLTLHRPPAPATQALVINRFRVVQVTTDNYMSKRAFKEQGSFTQFNSVIVGWVQVTKDIYDETTYNAFIGTEETSVGKQQQTVTLPQQAYHYFDGTDASNTDTDLEATARLGGQTIAEKVANLKADMTKKISKDFNDNQFHRRWAADRIMIVWNQRFLAKILKIDLPSLYHDKIFDDDMSDVLPQEYFGVTITSSNVSTYSASTPTTGKPINSTTHAYTPGSDNANGTIRAREEMTVTVSGTDYELFAGEELPAGAVIYTSSTDNLYGKIYIEDNTIICKVIYDVSESAPIMSSFIAETNWYNPLSLTETKNLIWSHNTLAHLKEFPFVTLRLAS